MENFDIVGASSSLPLICFKLKDDSRYSVFDISHKLRERGWILPAYTMPPNAEDIAVLRIVVREGFNRNLADLLIQDIQKVVEFFEKAGGIQEISSGQSHIKIC